MAYTEHAHGLNSETTISRDERLFVLRPYVFAPQRYEVCYAPWTVSSLPIRNDAPVETSSNPFVADLRPKSRETIMEYFGRPLSLSPPVLSHAAMLAFFVKRPVGGGGPSLEDAFHKLGLRLGARGGIGGASGGGMGANLRETIGAGGELGGSVRDEGGTQQLVDADLLALDEEDGDEAFGLIRNLVSDSTLHDRDFSRLIHCYDPMRCTGVQRRLWRGAFSGCWEGTFSFFEFEAFRDMIAGQSRALYEGQFGEQAQVWRMMETWVWREDYGRRKARQRAVEREERAARVKAQREARLAELRAMGEDDAEMSEGMDDIPSGLPLRGPATNAGFPHTRPGTVGPLDTPAAEDQTLKDTVKVQVDAIEGYEVVPDSELDEAFDAAHESGLEMILTGVGHSAWGRFILKGRVRAWDGLASLVKEYAPDSRGKWIYRGYVLSGDHFVGRWRDTFTPEQYVGYEGTFVLHRRR